MSTEELQGKGSRLRTPFNSVFVNQNSILTGVESIEATNVHDWFAKLYISTV